MLLLRRNIFLNKKHIISSLLLPSSSSLPIETFIPKLYSTSLKNTVLDLTQKQSLVSHKINLKCNSTPHSILKRMASNESSSSNSNKVYFFLSKSLSF